MIDIGVNIMNRVIIDLTGAETSKGTKFHGGGNYSRWVADQLNNHFQNIILLVGENLTTNSDEEKKFYEKYKNKIIKLKNLTSFEFEKNDILFIPLISNLKLFKLKKIKIDFPQIKLFVTIHGVRNIDLSRFDKYDKYYYKSFLKKNHFYSFIKSKGTSLFTIINLKWYIKFADKIFTDSNYSMQKIIQYGEAKSIKIIQPGGDSLSKNLYNGIKKGEYLLFLSANRLEKNFIRTLKAYIKIVKNNRSYVYKLFVTGISKKTDLNFKFDYIENEIIDKYVVFKGYVDSFELEQLYENANFVIYTSKSEGYGLPIIEATYRNKIVLASNLTSVPEVIGSAAYYVNPYSIESISSGILTLSEPKNLELFENNIENIRKIIEIRKKIELDNFINEFKIEMLSN
jgi:hypothetical protein